MKMNLWLALPAALTAIAFSQPASAAVVTYTYAGTVSYGFDGLGLFGEAGGDITGSAFTAVFYRDDALALPENIFQGEINSFVTGEGAYAPVRAVLTIGGVSLEIGGASGEQTQYDDGADEGFSHQAAGPNASLSLHANTVGTFAPSSLNYLAGPDYHTLQSLTAAQTPGWGWSGNFDFFAPEAAKSSNYTTGAFNPISLVVGPNPGGVVSPAPEPASWALMIVGFGAAGWTLRRRRALAFA